MPPSSLPSPKKTYTVWKIPRLLYDVILPQAVYYDSLFQLLVNIVHCQVVKVGYIKRKEIFSFNVNFSRALF